MHGGSLRGTQTLPESAVAAQAYTTPRHSVFSDSRDKGAGLPFERCAGGLEAGILSSHDTLLSSSAKADRQRVP